MVEHLLSMGLEQRLEWRWNSGWSRNLFGISSVLVCFHWETRISTTGARHFVSLPIAKHTRSQVCRVASNQSALETSDPGASNGGSNVEIRPHGADLVSLEVARLPQN